MLEAFDCARAGCASPSFAQDGDGSWDPMILGGTRRILRGQTSAQNDDMVDDTIPSFSRLSPKFQMGSDSILLIR